MILNLKNCLSDVGNPPVFSLYLPSSEWTRRPRPTFESRAMVLVRVPEVAKGGTRDLHILDGG
jgi:hypothetical protein